MELIHNQAFRIITGDDAGIYRIIIDEIQIGKTAIVRLDPPEEDKKCKGGRKLLKQTKRPRKKPRPPLLGKLLWFDRTDLLHLIDRNELIAIDITIENHALSKADEADFESRKIHMAPFLNYDHLQEQILVHKGISGLVQEVVSAGKSDSFDTRETRFMLTGTARSTNATSISSQVWLPQ